MWIKFAKSADNGLMLLSEYRILSIWDCLRTWRQEEKCECGEVTSNCHSFKIIVQNRKETIHPTRKSDNFDYRNKFHPQKSDAHEWQPFPKPCWLQANLENCRLFFVNSSFRSRSGWSVTVGFEAYLILVGDNIKLM